MTPQNINDLAEEITRKRKKWRTVPWIIVVGTITTVPSLANASEATSMAIFWGLVAIGGAFFDRKRRGVKIDLDIPESKQRQWDKLIDAFNQIRSCRKHWIIQTSERISKKESKKRAGANHSIDRKETKLEIKRPKNLLSSLSFPSLPFTDLTVYVTPYGLLIDNGKTIEAASKRDVALTSRLVSFNLYDEKKPKDARIIDHTWTYVNAKGGPDRRRKDNPEVPVAEFEEIDFTAPDGETRALMFSCTGGGSSFISAYRGFPFTKNGALLGSTTEEAEEDESTSPPETPQQDQPSPASEGFQAIVSRYAKQIDDKKIHFAPGIPKKILEAGLSSYATKARNESVFAQVDDTTFGGAKEGLIVTNEAIYLKEIFEKARRIALSDIERFETKGSLLGIEILVDGDKLANLHMPAKAALRRLGEMINEIVDHKRAEKQRARQSENQARAKSQNDAGAPPPTMEEILDKLDSLYEQGRITKEQYEAKRQKVFDVLG